MANQESKSIKAQPLGVVQSPDVEQLVKVAYQAYEYMLELEVLLGAISSGEQVHPVLWPLWRMADRACQTASEAHHLAGLIRDAKPLEVV